jgi:predicted MFS family arabinose efflux permease
MSQLLLERTEVSTNEAPTPAWVTFLLAVGCGLLAANIYYAQPLIGLIAPSIGLDDRAASLIVTFTLGGYCAGLILLVPLGDLIENRALVFWTLCAVVLALLCATFAPSAPLFLAACLFIGLVSVAAQMLVPIAAHLAPDASRGRMVGNVMSGLLTGIMLSRPISSLIANTFGWRAVFGFSALAIVVLAGVLRVLLPRREPTVDHSYFELLGSLWTLLQTYPLLRRRAAYQATHFAAFSLFWTTAPLLLAGPTFNLSQRGIGLFALAGAAGAIVAPIAGRLADRGWTQLVTGLSMVVVSGSFLLAKLGGGGSMAALVAAGILLDGAVQANQIVGQRAIYTLSAEARSRLNGLYVALFFIGGAAGSAIASLVYALSGWTGITWLGFALPLLALALFATEFVTRKSVAI